MRAQRYRYRKKTNVASKMSYEKKVLIQLAMCSIIFVIALMGLESQNPYMGEVKKYMSKMLRVSTSFEETSKNFSGLYEKIKTGIEFFKPSKESEPVDNLKPEDSPLIDNEYGMGITSALAESEKEKNQALEEEILQPNLPEIPAFRNPVEGEITSVFGNRLHPVTSINAPHTGIDIAGFLGTTVISAAPGYVVNVGYDDYNGNYVTIKHNENYESTYAHLNKVSVKTDEYVDNNTKIGEMGSSGLTTGVHLHFEIKQNGEKIDPEKFLKLPHRK